MLTYLLDILGVAALAAFAALAFGPEYALLVVGSAALLASRSRS